jgi:glyoxylate carboligase
MTAAEAMARALRDAGVRRMYGVPSGGSIVDLIEAGRRIGLRFVLAAAESPAAMMAATEAELTGVPGVCLATLGPGPAAMWDMRPGPDPSSTRGRQGALDPWKRSGAPWRACAVP